MPWSHGQRALLLTSLQEPATAPRCLSFWYRLAGPQIGTCPTAPSPRCPSPTLRTGGSPRAVGWLPPCPPLLRYPEPQAVAGGRGGGGAVDPPRKPGQHLAPGVDNTACHGPAAVPGEDRPPCPRHSKAQGCLTPSLLAGGFRGAARWFPGGCGTGRHHADSGSLRGRALLLLRGRGLWAGSRHKGHLAATEQQHRHHCWPRV